MRSQIPMRIVGWFRRKNDGKDCLTTRVLFRRIVTGGELLRAIAEQRLVDDRMPAIERPGFVSGRPYRCCISVEAAHVKRVAGSLSGEHPELGQKGFHLGEIRGAWNLTYAIS